MLTMPADASPYASILGIDPGTECLGVACIEFNVVTLEIHGAEAMTFKGSKLPTPEWVQDLHGDRVGRIWAHRENLLRVLSQVDPISIACESPFFNRMRPQAYGALTEIVYAVRNAIMDYTHYLDLTLIDPPSVKNAVGAKGNADKHTVHNAVLALPDLNYAGRIPLADLDEHSIDSLAVAYCRYKSLVR